MASKISVRISRNKSGEIYSFEIRDHGKDIVCAAVSALAFTAVNSIEAFTDLDFICDMEEDGGYMRLEIPFIREDGMNREAKLLLDSLVLGLMGIEEQYGNVLRIVDKEVR